MAASSSAHELDHAETLRASQVALKTVETQPSYLSSFAARLFGQAEDTRQWQQYEELLVASLKAGDEKTAQAILQKLISRFGAANERVMGLRGMYQEAAANNQTELEAVLQEYNEILKENRANIPIQKRRIALLKSLQQPDKAVEWLVELVKLNPTDIEAWSELSDLYFSLGQYQQAVFALEEVLLTLPNAWNIHARLGEILYVSATAHGIGKADMEIAFSAAIRRYCRSIELCDGYLRGYYGLSLATEKYLELFGDGRTSSSNKAAVSIEDAQRLHKRALSALKDMVAAQDGHYDKAEVDAAREFLSRRS